MPALLGRERNVREQAAHLRWVVVLDRCLEVFSDGSRLLELTPEPAQEADLSRPRHSGNCTVSESP